jgi:hypothetical protein
VDDSDITYDTVYIYVCVCVCVCEGAECLTMYMFCKMLYGWLNIVGWDG